ncbi:DMT family transporter [Pseudomonas tolaasii]|uniref:DMT family transporter n=1 Tax=Pseudomonas tolaasii TaxID=29442 RepID=UPI0015A1007F|nr:DMT family transporter [Pseudomonas tolaasii]NVZ48555.1 DMT family transporter [Pseudomonas tolaasii]NWA48905.1 DMT family transporter [Pseudomonas tolaasii]
MKRSTLGRFLLQGAFVLSWSSGYIGAKLGTQDGGAFNLLFWRFLLVVACLGVYLNVRLLQVTWAQVRHYAVVGFLSQFLYLSCLYVAIQNGLPPGIAAIIAALQPLMTAALSTGSATERSGGWEWAGLMISFVGVAVVIAGQYSSSGQQLGLVMYFLPLAAALGLTLATLYERRTVPPKGGSLVLPLFIQSVLTLIGFTGAVLYTGTLSIPRAPDVLISIVWLTVLSTLVAYLSLWMLLRRMSATHVAALVYLEPPVTLVWAALMFGDAIHVSTYAGMAVVVAGLLLVRLKRPAVVCAS